MKRCPTCQKTFDDNMRFCQTDGTPLVEDATPADPYKTMVASREDIQAALNAPMPSNEPAQAGIGAPEEEPLEIPSNPPQSASASEFETKIAGRDVIEIPPLAEATPPEPPRFSEPSTPPPSFGQSAPPSPFAPVEPTGPGDFPTTPPIPSPFNAPKPASFEPPAASHVPEPEQEEKTYFEPEQASQSYSEPEPVASTPQYAEPEPAAQQFNPFQGQSTPESASLAQAEWTPPPSPVQSTPAMMSPPPATAGGKVNQTLSLISLIAGILGLTICCGSLVPSVVAIITGIMGRGKASRDPQHYGGAGLALAGIITGVIGLLGGIVVLLMYLPVIIAIIANAGR